MRNDMLLRKTIQNLGVAVVSILSLFKIGEAPKLQSDPNSASLGRAGFTDVQADGAEAICNCTGSCCAVAGIRG